MEKYLEYANAVKNNEILSCQKTKLAVYKFLADYDKALNDADYPYYFDAEYVAEIIIFIEKLKLTDGKWYGKKIELMTWQHFIIAGIYGFKSKETGNRKITTAFIHIPRKVGKTTLIATLMILALLSENGGQVYSIAKSREQAAISFKIIKGFIEGNEKLRNIIDDGLYSNYIHYKPIDSYLRPLSSDSGSHNGLGASFVLADEVATYKSRDLLDTMSSSQIARDNPLLIMITSSNFINNSIGFEEYEKLDNILNKRIEDDNYFGISYELDLEDDWKDIKFLKKAMPSLGHTVSIEAMERELVKALNDEGEAKKYKTMYLNKWIFGAKDNWIPNENWIANYINEEPEEEAYKDVPCFGGMDLSRRNDLTVYTLAFPINQNILLKHRIYIPRNQIENKMKKDSYLFYQWIEKGLVRIAGEDVIDYEVVMNDIREDNRKYNLQYIAYDELRFAEGISQLIEEEGITLIPFKMNYTKMGQSLLNFENLVFEKRIIDKNPVMNWCINNAVRNMTNANDSIIKIKKANTTSRIDPVITSVIATQFVIEFNKEKNKPEQETIIDELAKFYGKQ